MVYSWAQVNNFTSGYVFDRSLLNRGLFYCRRPLFRQSGVMGHEVCVNSATVQFKGHRTGRMNSSAAAVAGSACDVFVEPVAWMSNMILTIEGKVR